MSKRIGINHAVLYDAKKELDIALYNAVCELKDKDELATVTLKIDIKPQSNLDENNELLLDPIKFACSLNIKRQISSEKGETHQVLISNRGEVRAVGQISFFDEEEDR